MRITRHGLHKPLQHLLPQPPSGFPNIVLRTRLRYELDQIGKVGLSRQREACAFLALALDAALELRGEVGGDGRGAGDDWRWDACERLYVRTEGGLGDAIDEFVEEYKLEGS